jgi:hypothetical protein
MVRSTAARGISAAAKASAAARHEGQDSALETPPGAPRRLWPRSDNRAMNPNDARTAGTLSY